MATRTQKHGRGKVVDLNRERQARPVQSYKRKEPPRQTRDEEAGAPGQSGRRGAAVLLAILLFCTLTVLIGWEYFTVRGIAVEGCQLLASDRVAALSGVRLGENIFMLDTALVKQRLESEPLIRVLLVRRELPNRVLLRIEEREPWAVIAMVGRYAVLSDDYVVIDVRDDLPPGGYPLIVGLAAWEYQPGDRLSGDKEPAVLSLMGLMAALSDTGSIDYIAQIDLHDLENVSMLSQEDIVIRVGSMDKLNEKFALLAQSMPRIREEGLSGGTLYLTASGMSYAPQATPVPEEGDEQS